MQTNRMFSTKTNKDLNRITVSLALTILLLFPGFAAPALSADGLVSTMEMMNAVAAVDGIRVVSANDVPGRIYTEDYAPSQVWEIIRPNMQPISVGRLTTSCSCLQASMEKRTFGQGERAFIEVRNVKPSQPQGAEYGLFVQLTSPYRAALQAEVYVRSNRQPGDPGGIPHGSIPLESIFPSNVTSSTIVINPTPPSATPGGPRFKYEQIAPFAPKTPAPAPAGK